MTENGHMTYLVKPFGIRQRSIEVPLIACDACRANFKYPEPVPARALASRHTIPYGHGRSPYLKSATSLMLKAIHAYSMIFVST
eukprot:6211771-Pleurochrysis_carterae.AAC.1